MTAANADLPSLAELAATVAGRRAGSAFFQALGKADDQVATLDRLRDRDEAVADEAAALHDLDDWATDLRWLS